MPETTPLIKAALNLRGGAGFDVYVSVVDRRVKSKFMCKEASFFAFVLKSLFFVKKIQKQGFWMLWKSLFS